MVHQTFHNLPPEKRERIQACAMEEFISYPYEKTNIKRIADSAGIAKGSFYQYFDTKDDLYALCMAEVLAQVLDIRSVGDTVLFFDILQTMELDLARKKDDILKDRLEPRRYDFLQTLPHIPRPLRNEIALRAVTKLVAPRLRKQLMQDKRIRRDIDYDFYAFLLGMSEFIALEYGALNQLDLQQMREYSARYLRLLYDSILKI